MPLRLNQLMAAMAKELTICGRDPDVFIYSVMLPALIYPLLFFFASEFILWRSGAIDEMKVKVALSQSAPPVAGQCMERLKKEKYVTAPESKQPMKDLEDGRLDVVIGSTDGKEVEVFIKKTSPAAADVEHKLTEFFIKWQREHLKEKLASQAKDYLKIFDTERLDAAPPISQPSNKPNNAASLGSARLILCAILCMACSSMAYGTMAPAVCLFTEERERNTLPTTLLLPASRWLLVLAKVLSTVIVALLSGLANLTNMILVGVVLLSQTKVLSTLNVALLLTEITPLLRVFHMVLLAVAFAVALASTFALAASWARDYSQAYNMLMLPLLWSSITPLAGALPMLHQIEITAWLPVANIVYLMVDALNADITVSHFAIAVVENMLLVVGAFVTTKHLLTSERTLRALDG